MATQTNVIPNTSETTRECIYMGYCYRWVKPLDYLSQPEDLMAQATPVQRQLLGEQCSEMTFWLPKPGEVPLEDWLKAHQAETLAAAGD